jgi:phytoene synthase
MSESDDLDALVRRVDPDRWLASRFAADAEARADLIALYAFNHEIVRAAEVASQPLVGEMRLAWWREALAEMFEGRPVRAHPAAQALSTAVSRRSLDRAELDALIDARHRDLEPWPLMAEEAEGHVDATAGRLMRLAARLLAPEADPAAVLGASRAWGLAGLHRLGGRLPADWSAEEVGRRVREHLAAARSELARLPVAAFPATAYATLSGSYAAGRAPGEFWRRVRLTVAVLRGTV